MIPRHLSEHLSKDSDKLQNLSLLSVYQLILPERPKCGRNQDLEVQRHWQSQNHKSLTFVSMLQCSLVIFKSEVDIV